MANKYWPGYTSLTGGGAGALDLEDGAGLTDGDIAEVVVSNVLYIYRLNATSTESELSPWRIQPDANAGTKIWELASPLQSQDGWKLVTAANYTAAPASTSTITMLVDMTTSIKVGMSLKYTIGGTVYYGMVSAIAAGLLTVNGAPLGGDVTNLCYDGGEIRQMQVTIPGAYEDASNTALITSDLNSNLIWKLPTSYLVWFSVYSDVHDSGAHGQASVRINNTEVNTTAGGETIAADTTWYPTVVNIATAAYDINPGEALEVTCVAGGNGDATDLTVAMVFVTP
jgi:hypothetical protein